jgi:serine/threonine protein kinase
MLEEGRRLGEFEILTQLGQGGMGAVYKARQTVLRRLVAIKTLQPSLSSDAEFVSRFLNEAVAAAGLNHPNLVQVYAAGESDGIHWFAMEFVDGESVQARLKRLGKLDPAEALAICIHVQTALEYGWRKAQLIHRDIKPDNIFLSNDGEVKLGDLGLAKSSDQQQGLTMTGASMGTPLYISPEQTEGKRDIDLRTDIYSLGATLYHLIAGTPPYTGESSISVMMKHVGAPVPDIRDLDPSLPPALSAVLVKMMQKAPADRYGSYEELGAALRNAYAALSDPGAGESPLRDAGDGATSDSNTGRKRPAWLLPAVAVPLVALGALALFKFKASDPQEKATTASNVPAPADRSTVSKSEPVGGAKKTIDKEAVPANKVEAEHNVNSVEELVRDLEAKLLPVPGTEILMSKTELTVGEWKVYLKEAKLPVWTAPREFQQTNQHPVVEVSALQAVAFCRWLSEQTGMTWRLPTNQEWDLASPSMYPWGNYFPPRSTDGNYAVSTVGTYDSNKMGADGVFGTAPVASFKPNELGFYDLGGNVAEWVTVRDSDAAASSLRGAGWMDPGPNIGTESLGSKYRRAVGVDGSSNRGFRVVRLKKNLEKAASLSVPEAPTPSGAEKPPSSQAQAAVQTPSTSVPQPPRGFRSLFDGATLTGWHGLNPHDIAKEAPERKATLVQQQRNDFPKCWRVENGELVNLGTGPYATTLESFGNIDLLIEYKTVAGADSGIYLRGTPQIQIWDTTLPDTPNHKHSLGSGGLFNNTAGSPGRDPLVRADKPFGQWNQFRIRQIGARTWVWLNEKQVVDGALWEPFWDKSKPLPEKAPIMLQTFGGEIRWRNIFVRDIPDAEAGDILKAWNSAQIQKKNAPQQTPLQELVQRLESKLLPVPGLQVRISKTEFTVGEWKLYLRAAGLPEWQQPERNWDQTDEHPLVKVSWDDAMKFCEWLSTKTGREWRLPTNAEWNALVGQKKYPWGDYYPPHWDDGNYSVLEDGTRDPKVIGVDGILGTAPVGAFNPNELGFYDVGGNVWEMTGPVEDNRCHLRGAGWEVNKPVEHTRSDWDEKIPTAGRGASYIGFRLVRK